MVAEAGAVPQALGLSSIEAAIASIAAGRPVIVVDDEDRENEGDVILSAELASPEWIAWTVAHSSGFICAPLSTEIADALDLPPMVAHNEDVRGTAYTVTVDAAVGVTTGISAHDRARTLRVLADPTSVRDDLHRPGHVVPLRARPGGVRERAGHTEAAIELVTAAGLRPAAAICEIVDEDGSMMRLPALVALGAREGVPVITIAALAEWLDAADRAAAATAAPTEGTTR
ncbi:MULTISPECIES: 3,4-dihydroxy-2-butanone-4-phosphate synthase [Curtobacterium]|jgi:3,4-dihydroxy 2-butanone 4-phosphate synthase/GTP cyclohydrolase II|uniref:3,4-dihydroxy-2-butanone-4-phosphate synthase n=1 Tax=Curtobacterium TaxID=2034 RepID=UPI000A00DF06|nr:MULTISPECIES: 3,4-dihydroxy-2-butanone-4-phosphate synthase [Curtobacterium]MBB1198316.1 3,4-dihydroxy-2-butanone-4-phosphate synthase [Curtobacterium flaccumfaciens]MBT1681666.1 3,4-dihydroxy-2-butanone-4-phosphate synthase [Curtobacterium flaccumfaciens pv. flaccumfaciens]MCS0645733.1 3,4-dihydroxy-2-butanone-4-phosphate synthase [Curtobacterium flaccumfaciens pv. flaccumfaciens]MCS6525644.1 3,4-dihydroxy-2-butanone-4-phosphate synthase [Curtobacterium flaccumfaciens pv. flaccumfaciens]MC